MESVCRIYGDVSPHRSVPIGTIPEGGWPAKQKQDLATFTRSWPYPVGAGGNGPTPVFRKEMREVLDTRLCIFIIPDLACGRIGQQANPNAGKPAPKRAYLGSATRPYGGYEDKHHPGPRRIPL